MSSLIIERRFFVSAALCLAATSCRCSDDEAARGSDLTERTEAEVEEVEDAPRESAHEGARETTGVGRERARTLEVVTAEELLGKLRASERKGTLVNAWASFCGPCKREIPMLEALAKRLRPRGLDVVLVSVDEPGDEAKALAFLEERGIGLTSYVAARPLGAFKRGMNPGWPGMLPASFLFDDQGALRYYWGGEAFEDEVSPVLEAFLAGKALDGIESTPLVAPEGPD